MKYPIPSSALDDRLAFTGSSGTGKTYDCGTAIERILASRSRACIVDPLGVWWGLRLASDGKTASKFKVVIFGGPHGDIAITETSGRLIGETIAGMAEACIVDLSEFDTDASQRRFMLALLVALYSKHKGELLHLVLDEADMWAPQRIMDKEGDATKLHHNMQKIVRRGRVKGFIPWLLTQRPAELSKSVLSMMDGIVAHQVTSPQDVNAVMDWVKPHADKQTVELIHEGLPTFERGQAAIYIPRRRILSVAQFPQKVTFDSSRSPERGEKKNRPDVALKALDLDALKKRLEKVETEAKANDPAKLRAEIVQLRAEKAKLEKGAPVVVPAAKNAAVEQRELARALNSRFQVGVEEGFQRANAAALASLKTFHAAFAKFEAGLNAPVKTKAVPLSREAASIDIAERPSRAGKTVPSPSLRTSPKAAEGGDASLTNPQRQLLAALAWWQHMGHDAPTRVQVAAIAGWKPKGSNLRNRLTELSSAGLVSYPDAGAVSLTETGLAAAPEPDTSRTLLDRIRAVLTSPQLTVFEAILDSGVGHLERLDIAKTVGWEPGGSNLRNRLTELSALELVHYPSRGTVALQDWVLG